MRRFVVNRDGERRKDYVNVHTTVAEHSIQIDMLGKAMEDLAIATTHTNEKLDKVADALSVTSIIMEKLSNLDENIKDSFKRRDDRLDGLEKVQADSGCSKLNVAEESIKSLGRSIDTAKAIHKSDEKLMSDRVDKLEDKVDNIVSGATIKWAIGIFLVITMGFIGFVNVRYAEVSQKIVACRATEAVLTSSVRVNESLQASNTVHCKEALHRIEESIKEGNKK